MKKLFKKKLGRIIIIGMLFFMGVNYFLQLSILRKNMVSESEILFQQIIKILNDNKTEVKETEERFENRCRIKAKTAAYMLQYNPSVISDQKEIKRMAELLEIDEIHIFNEDGVIYAGSEPKYYGYSFHSGPQMQFFLPMLEDKTKELCQPITPNTAEGKPMQYVAVWNEDRDKIIQIGMEPQRVLEVTKRNELSQVFSRFTKKEGTHLYAIDADTYTILGSTDNRVMQKKLDDIGVPSEKIEHNKMQFHASPNGEISYCVFTEWDNILIGRSCTLKQLYNGSNSSTFFVMIYMLAISLIMIRGISGYLDAAIVQSIDKINDKLKDITDGDLNEKVAVDTTPEFEVLSGHINTMVTSLVSMKEQIEKERDEDLLTGLWNRRAFYRLTEELFDRPEDLKYAAVIAIDTDNLKLVNDVHGHEMGDCYLRSMANILRNCTAPQRILSHVSGDEFSAVIYGCESKEELQRYIAEIQNRQTDNEIVCRKDVRIPVRFSMGCAYYRQDGEEYENLLKRADNRMYEDKRRRKDGQGKRL